MTKRELLELLKDYDDDHFIFIRIWLRENIDYLDEGYIDTVATKIQQSTSGDILITGTDKEK